MNLVKRSLRFLELLVGIAGRAVGKDSWNTCRIFLSPSLKSFFNRIDQPLQLFVLFVTGFGRYGLIATDCACKIMAQIDAFRELSIAQVNSARSNHLILGIYKHSERSP